MHQRKEELPVTMEDGGLSVRLTGWGNTAVTFMQMPAGVDLTPALAGLPEDLCQCPHWGYVLEGAVHVRYADGEEETVERGNVYYWPAGHTVWFDEDTKYVEFSPEAGMRDVLEHVTHQSHG
ncbi:cupin domain-containing protein [Rubrobacter aplysinae]|uniref:hypothetical protein n=1 Tax=Rubrobacter aplysinae TaxID=909625 RepID=UPI00064C1F40|nr:hypothetical protein [Rubrobacter aplysinae]